MIRITNSIFYCGVNDRDTHLFENLWPLPYGVSYNSYLVKGSDKTALIDTVHENYVASLLTHLRADTDGKGIDYLVVNHVEPDHSGALPTIVAAFPELKIIGNRQTIGMLKGFYGIDDDRFIEIKEGDTLPLGDVSLKFIITPMVHWPETMMTYVPERKLLFTGDAFGCFGALNGGVLDSSMDMSIYFDEMYRYYSNIVGKYGRFVQQALTKTSGVEIEFLCSTHGPVWHDNLKEVAGIYDRLSRYEPEEGVTIIYGTMYGNTTAVAEAMAQRLCEHGVRNIRIHNASKSHMSNMISDAFRYKGLIVGAPTYSMSLFPPIEEFMKAMETREIKNKTVALFGSFTWASASLKKLLEYTQRMGLEPVGTLELRQSIDDATLSQVRQLADTFASSL